MYFEINLFVFIFYEGFSGERCETNINDCKDNSCSENGVCVDLINSYKCQCNYGYEGDR